ncbi:MAG: sigma 54-interacting transcriptional regulator [Ignavibacteriales bacterium]|nr:sigma 54-interacting transcriptional regulator [Ignavibacteriales bacterium]
MVWVSLVVKKPNMVDYISNVPLGKPISIGRHELNDVYLEDATNEVSRFHAALFSDKGGNYLIQDLGSRNGTFIKRGEYYSEYYSGIVKLGDEIKIGPYVMTLEKSLIKKTQDVFSKSASSNDVETSFPDATKSMQNSNKDKNDLYKDILRVFEHPSMELDSTIDKMLNGMFNWLTPKRIYLALLNETTNEIDAEYIKLSENSNNVGIIFGKDLINFFADNKEIITSEEILAENSFKEIAKFSNDSIAYFVPIIWGGCVKGFISIEKFKYSESDINDIIESLKELRKRLSDYLAGCYKKSIPIKYQSAKEIDIDESVIIGVSRRFKKDVIDEAIKISNKDINVLLLGETGTGKDLLASYIHKNSTRADKPFVAINCASLPDQLIESELFGHEENAFTGAKFKQGLVESANGGSLFLDEIGELSLALQPKLYRFLQSGEFRRVGGIKNLTSFVRIIAATNKNLEDDTVMRPELFNRINQSQINIPPLRDRKEDIPLLAGYFLILLRQKYSTKISRLNHDCIKHLQARDWMGNIRALQNAIARAIIDADSHKSELDIKCFAGISEEVEKDKSRGDSANIITDSKYKTGDSENNEGKKLETSKDVEKAHILKVLSEENGKVDNAAIRLGISKQTLYNKLKKYEKESGGASSESKNTRPTGKPS